MGGGFYSASHSPRAICPRQMARVFYFQHRVSDDLDFFILKKFQFDDIRRDAEKKFGVTIGDIFLGGELAKAKRIESLPKMLKKLTIKELKDFFSEQAKELGARIFE